MTPGWLIVPVTIASISFLTVVPLIILGAW